MRRPGLQSTPATYAPPTLTVALFRLLQQRIWRALPESHPVLTPGLSASLLRVKLPVTTSDGAGFIGQNNSREVHTSLSRAFEPHSRRNPGHQ